MTEPRELLQLTASLAAEYLESLPHRPVFPTMEPDELRAALGGPSRTGRWTPTEVITELARRADPGSSHQAAGVTSDS